MRCGGGDRFGGGRWLVTQCGGGDEMLGVGGWPVTQCGGGGGWLVGGDNDSASHERHEEKKDPEHVGRHKVEEAVAAAADLYAFHEQHEKEEAKEHKKCHHLV
ncbi:uncharacterized protein LOC133927995 [Phragmites australis]|uniref:uncharacterized protein LOC133927995 n=1 Tax=Phragmites australis TaxID=29695 RepID=UPI002D776168|nr:uncharacterized protein LOC133927995 [Phragmites australis]